MSKSKEQREWEPEWTKKCDNCGETPIVPDSELCGPCYFGTAQALMGGWWDDEKKEFIPMD